MKAFQDSFKTQNCEIMTKIIFWVQEIGQKDVKEKKKPYFLPSSLHLHSVWVRVSTFIKWPHRASVGGEVTSKRCPVNGLVQLRSGELEQRRWEIKEGERKIKSVF